MLLFPTQLSPNPFYCLLFHIFYFFFNIPTLMFLALNFVFPPGFLMQLSLLNIFTSVHSSLMKSFIQHIIIFGLGHSASWNSALNWKYSILTVRMFSYRLWWVCMEWLIAVNDTTLDFTYSASCVRLHFV